MQVKMVLHYHDGTKETYIVHKDMADHLFESFRGTTVHRKDTFWCIDLPDGTTVGIDACRIQSMQIHKIRKGWWS